MLTSIIRTIIIYVLIFIAFRIMGKRQISEMQASELVATIILSELAVIPIQNHDEPLLNGIVPMLIIVALEIFSAFLMIKSHWFRKLTCGKPIVLIEKGKLNQANLREVKMTVEDLCEQLRQKGAFFMEDVEYAIIETSGQLSVIKRPESDPVTPKQMQLKAEPGKLEVVVVSDGVISESSLKISRQTEDWVQERVKQSGFSLKEVFIMTVDSNGKYRIVPKEI